MATGTKRVLVVDDEPGFTEMVKLSLEQAGGYVVREENDARRAVAAARNFMPHLILLDVMMPDMDGGDVARALSRDPELANVPVVYLTALVSQQEAPKSSQHRYLPKPSSMSELVEAIQSTINAGF